MEYRIYPLTDQSRLEELCTLFATGLADTTPEYWKWKHYSENGHPEGTVLVAETEDESMAGMFALQPEIYRYNGTNIVIVQMMDLVIAPSYRGRGLMKTLFSYAKEHYSALGYWGFLGFPNEVSYPILTKYGATDMGDICSYETVKRILPLYLAKKREIYQQWQIAFADAPPEDLFDLQDRQECRMVRSPAFLRWKFAQNPETAFQWLTLRKDGNLHGYMAVSIVRGRFRRAVNIYDWALRPSVDERVLKLAVDLLLTHGNWVNLWGKFSDADLALWAKAGVSNPSSQRTHFLLIPFDGNDIPGQWHLSRADLDY